MLCVTGIKIVKEFIRSSAQRVSHLFILENIGSSFEMEMAELADAKGISLTVLSADSMQKIYRGKVKNGIVARMDRYVFSDIEDLIEERDHTAVFVMLDRVYDPHNLGAIARSAYCFGAKAVIIQQKRAPSITEAAIHASAGALAHLPVVQVVNLAKTADYLKKKGFWIFGTATAEGIELEKLDTSSDMVIIFGSEGLGIRKKLLEKCDFKISIPLRGDFDSLNVSVAAGIVLHAVSGKMYR